MINNSIALSSHTPQFQNGFIEGLSGVKPDNCLWPLACPVTEDDIVSVINNLTEIAVEGWLDQAQLRHDAGLLAGWICRSVRC